MIVDNGCPDINGVQQPNCSKLGAGERITVMASECGYSTHCPTASAAVCRSIINDGAVNYFVPWRTDEEWGAFLSQLTPMSPLDPGAVPLPDNNLAISKLPHVSVGACCDPMKVPDVCPGYPCAEDTPGYPNCSSVAAHGLPDDLGYRRVGTRVGVLDHYGAQGDVYGPIKSADFFGDSTINYEVTYVCHNGGWIKSYEVGSCVPTAGACNNALPDPLPKGWTLPSDLNNLCDKAKGSTIDSAGLTGNGSSYSWICNGTPTMPSAKCSRNKYVAPLAYNGVCGSAHNGRLLAPPGTDAEKCASGDSGILTGNGSGASPWVWICKGGNGGGSQNCGAYLQGAPLDGICGAADGMTATLSFWMPTPAQMCARSFTTPVPVKTGNILNWTCFGESGGADIACGAKLKLVNGICGVPNTYVVTTPPHNPPILADLPPGACGGGTPVNIAYDGINQILFWDCAGDNGGGTASCSAGVNTSLIKGKCMWPFGAVLGGIPLATSAALCASGAADNVVTSGAVPTVGITWNCLGNMPGHDVGCAVSVHIKTDAVCGSASGTQQAGMPGGGALCAVGTPSAVTGGSTGPVWGWRCAGIWGGLTDYCGATYDNTPTPGSVPVNGACNPSKLAAQATRPSGALCDVGTPTAATGSGPWTWQCLGLNGGGAAACVAPRLGAGFCGATHGTRIPNKPNANLCATGTAGVVTGDDVNGWNWTCAGTNTVSCHADPCDICNGDLAAMARHDSIADQTISYGSGTCRVKGTVEWSAVDRLAAGNSAYSVAMNDGGSGLSYGKSQLPPAAPTDYCTPCYRYPKTISGAFFRVERKSSSDSCGTGTALDTPGNSMTIPASSVTITP